MAFKAIRANIWKLLLVEVVSFALSLLHGIATMAIFRGGAGPNFLAVTENLAVSLILSCCTFVLLFNLVVGHLQGRSTTALQALRAGSPRILPALAVFLLFVVGVYLASFFLLVPGLMLLCAWYVAVPVVVSEKVGVFAAFSRSAALTAGNRWHVLGVHLLAMMVLVAPLMLLVWLGEAHGAGGMPADMLTAMSVGLLFSVAAPLLISGILGATYFELRRIEGGGAERLAEVFG